MAKVGSVLPRGLDLTEAAAGIPSVKHSLSQEPPFPRKKRAEGGVGESQISREGVLRLQEEERATRKNEAANRALSFRAGYRRPQPAPIPSEYQMQFTWKTGRQLDAPLLQAAERLRHDEGGEGGGKEGERGGGVGKRKRKSVEPEVRGHHRKKEEQKTHVTDGGKSHLRKGRGVSESRSPEPGYGRKGRQPVSRRKQRGHKAQPRSRKAGRTGESEYRTQFKAWPIAPRTSENLRGTRRKTAWSPRKRSDITDLGLVAPSPLPPAPQLPGPLRMWGTEYSSQFRSPLDFKYIRGAWMETPQPSPSCKSGGMPSPVKSSSGGMANGGTQEPEADSHDSSEEEEEEEEEEERRTEREGERVADEQPTPQESLLAQLSEIRSKAVQYRQRSDGCHFLPAHPSWRLPADDRRETTPIRAHPGSPSGTAPIRAHPQSPSGSSGASSLSCEEPVGENGIDSLRDSVPHTLTNSGLHVVDVEDEEEEEEEEEEGEGEQEGSECSSSGESEEEDPKHAGRQPTTADIRKPKPPRIPATTTSPSIPHNEEIEGRIPTPILQQSSGNALRHHLDRTTPSSGAVLTSPTPPAFVKTTKSKGVSSSVRDGTSRGGRAGRQPCSVGGVRVAPLSTRSSGHKERGGKMCSAEVGKKGLHLSQTSARFKRDPSLVSSAPTHSTSHLRTLPKSSLAQHQRDIPSATPRAPVTHRSHHTLTTSPPHPSPPHSTISSLLSSLRSSSPSSNPPNKRLDYSRTNGGIKATASSARPAKPPLVHCRSSHAGGGCTNGQCDICGAWLRRTPLHTGAQVSNPSLNRQLPPAALLVSSGSHRYRGPVTQLAEKLKNRGAPSHSGVRASSVGSSTNSNSPHQNGVVWSNSPLAPSRGAATVPPQSAPRPLRAADELSISSLSLSSCSVASDLLRKARERRENFWTQPPNPTART